MYEKNIEKCDVLQPWIASPLKKRGIYFVWTCLVCIVRTYTILRSLQIHINHASYLHSLHAYAYCSHKCAASISCFLPVSWEYFTKVILIGLCLLENICVLNEHDVSSIVITNTLLIIQTHCNNCTFM